jgi:hypothetical protein
MTAREHHFLPALAALPLSQRATGLMPQPVESVINSWLNLNISAQQRLLQNQQENLQAWGAWLQRIPQIARANTMSKLAEQEMNVLMSAGQLASQQLVDLISLQENLQVNYSYWFSLHHPAAGLMSNSHSA